MKKGMDLVTLMEASVPEGSVEPVVGAKARGSCSQIN